MPILNMYGRRTAGEVRKSFLRETGFQMDILVDGAPADDALPVSRIRKLSTSSNARRSLGSEINGIFAFGPDFLVEDLKIILSKKYCIDTAFRSVSGDLLPDDTSVLSLFPKARLSRDESLWEVASSVINRASSSVSSAIADSVEISGISDNCLSACIDDTSLSVQYFIGKDDPEFVPGGKSLLFEQFIDKGMFSRDSISSCEYAAGSPLLNDLLSSGEYFFKDIERIAAAEFVFQTTVRKFRIEGKGGQ